MNELLILVLVVATAYFIWHKKTRASSKVVTQASLPGPGDFAYDIVGESNYQDALEQICGGKRRESAEHYVDAILYFENDNKHDPKAIRVDVQGRTVGYLPRQDARAYRAQILAMGRGELACQCKAKVVGGWHISKEDQGSFGVKLDLPLA